MTRPPKNFTSVSVSVETRALLLQLQNHYRHQFVVRSADSLIYVWAKRELESIENPDREIYRHSGESIETAAAGSSA